MQDDAAAAGGALVNPLFWGGLASTGTASYLMTNPKFIKWLAQGSTLSKADVQSHIVRLGNMATLSHDDEFKSNVETYLQSVNE